MEAKIAEGIYRISAYVLDIAPRAGFTFNYFLVLGASTRPCPDTRFAVMFGPFKSSRRATSGSRRARGPSGSASGRAAPGGPTPQAT
jgi:hypothetical protein